jgi:hypothetical protein
MLVCVTDPRASEHKLGGFYGEATPDKGVVSLAEACQAPLKGALTATVRRQSVGSP